MKKVLIAFLVFICLLTTINFFTPTQIQAAKYNSDKQDLFSIIRTVENGRHYVYLFVNSIFISKCEEL